MKKIIFIAALFLVSCTKSEEKGKICYKCEFAQFINLPPEPPRTVCLYPSEDIKKQRFTDGRGNDLSAICTKK